MLLHSTSITRPTEPQTSLELDAHRNEHGLWSLLGIRGIEVIGLLLEQGAISFCRQHPRPNGIKNGDIKETEHQTATEHDGMVFTSVIGCDSKFC